MAKRRDYNEASTFLLMIVMLTVTVFGSGVLLGLWLGAGGR